MRANLFVGVIVFTVFWCATDAKTVFDRDSFRTTPSDSLLRVKRQQTPDPTDQFFNNVFQIPISTLNAVNELIKSTRPVIRRARERIQQQYQTWQQNGGNVNGNRLKPQGRDANSE
ncbi:uncharacterized protein LOC135835749 [Planococcus citri]|uniref:uncharacterized protein LOC135835749 n=1 Tax=Planococcus citri TaxID=170843 RepID=UPI0031F8BE8C